MIQEDIAGLKVTVKHTTLVRVMDGARDCHHQINGFLFLRRELMEAVRETSALDEAHGQKRSRFAFTDFIDSDDIGMIQFRSRVGFAAKARKSRNGSETTAAHHFQRNDAIQRKLTGAKHRAHAPLSELFEEL